MPQIIARAARAFGALVLTAQVFAPIDARAQDRDRPVTIVVPYAAGENSPDVLARMLAGPLQQRLGQAVVVENLPGASGNIGSLAVARAKPDGNTLLMAAPAFAENVSLYRNVPFDPVGDFAPVIDVAHGPFSLIVNAALPVRSTREFIDYVKARPGQLNYATPGVGTPHHLTMELFKLATGVDIKHVPYIGSGPSMQSVMSGQTSAMFLSLTAALPALGGENVRLLGLTEHDASGVAPNAQSFAEQGIAGVEMVSWNGLLAPAATPRAVVERLNAQVAEILSTPEFGAQLRKLALYHTSGPPERFAGFIKAEVEKWRRVVKEAGIVAE